MYEPDIKKCPKYLDKQEYAQECWLAKLSDDSLSDDEISDIAIKKLKKEKSFDFKKAPHLYNEEGECIDDNYYFVDPSTVEQFGEGRRITDAQFTEGKKLARAWHLTNALYCQSFLIRAFYGDASVLNRASKIFFEPYIKKKFKICIAQMIKGGNGSVHSSLHWLRQAKRFQKWTN